MMDLYLPPKPAIIVPRPKEIVRPGDPRFVVPGKAVIGGLGVMALCGGGGGTEAPKVLTYQTTANSSSDLTTYTFAAQAIGTAAADRRVIVGFRSCGGTAASISSATIGGVSASIIAQVAGSTCVAGIIIALVPTGTTGDVVVTLNAGALRAAVGVWSCIGLTSNTANHSGTSTASPGAVTLNVQSGGFAVGMIGQNNTSSYGWTNLTERFDANDAESASHSGADSNGETGSGTLVVSCSYSVADTNRAMVAASW